MAGFEGNGSVVIIMNVAAFEDQARPRIGGVRHWPTSHTPPNRQGSTFVVRSLISESGSLTRCAIFPAVLSHLSVGCRLSKVLAKSTNDERYPALESGNRKGSQPAREQESDRYDMRWLPLAGTTPNSS